MPKIFISYRRADSAETVNRLYDRLVYAFGRENIFKDVDSLQRGDDFPDVLRNWVQTCDVFLSIIGQRWLTIQDEAGRRRLDNPNDWVRHETEMALARGNSLVLIPTLVDDTVFPQAAHLPETLTSLINRNSHILSTVRFHEDINALTAFLRQKFHLTPPPPSIDIDKAFRDLAEMITVGNIEAARDIQAAMRSQGSIPPRIRLDAVEQSLYVEVQKKERDLAYNSIHPLADLADIGLLPSEEVVAALEAFWQIYRNPPNYDPKNLARFKPSQPDLSKDDAVEEGTSSEVDIEPNVISSVALAGDTVTDAVPSKQDESEGNQPILTEAPTKSGQEKDTTSISSVQSHGSQDAQAVPEALDPNVVTARRIILETVDWLLTKKQQQPSEVHSKPTIESKNVLKTPLEGNSSARKKERLPTSSDASKVQADIVKDSAAHGRGINNKETENVWIGIVGGALVLLAVVAFIIWSISNQSKNLSVNNLATATIDYDPTVTAMFASARNGISHNVEWSVSLSYTFQGHVNMVLVPRGCFDMGDEGAGGRVCIEKPYFLDKYEVSNEQFARLGGESSTQSRWNDDKLPRQNVTWFEARVFCEKKRGGRLPTEAEWEYAARGPDNNIFPWGNIFDSNSVVYRNNSIGQPKEVGSHPSGTSWVGALDLSGNLWEWMANAYHDYPYPIPSSSEETSEWLRYNDEAIIRVVRGGSWSDTSNDYVSATRRGAYEPDIPRDIVGFRCARDS